MKKILILLLTLSALCLSAAGAGAEPSSFSKELFPVIPFVKTPPAMRDSFREKEWEKALKLTNFTPRNKGEKPEKTTINLLRDKNSLYIAAVMEGEDIPSLLRQKENALKKMVYSVNRIEMLLGDNAYFQFMMDYLNRTYCNMDTPLYTWLNLKKNLFVVRIAIALDQIPRAVFSRDVIKMNFFRIGSSGVSSWKPYKKSFLDTSTSGAVFLKSPEKLLRDMASSYRTRIQTLFETGSLTKEDAALLLENVEKKLRNARKAHYSAAVFLKELSAFDLLSQDIGKAQEKNFRKNYGIFSHGIVNAYKGKIPESWLPARFMGKDFHYAYTIIPGYNTNLMEETGMLKHPLYRNGMFHVRFFQGNFSDNLLNEKSELAKFLAKYSENLILMAADQWKINPKARGMINLFDHDFMAALEKKYGRRIAGFTSPESYVNGAEMQQTHFKNWKIAPPKNRKEAYNAIKKLYNTSLEKIPKFSSFRNIGLNSKYARKFSNWNSAAATFNHLFYSFGDKVSGNENGECCGPTPTKYAFARGAARQYGKPWENYQIYYGWAYLKKFGGGMQCAPTSGLPRESVNSQLTPESRVRQYCYLNGLYVGTGLERQKSQILHPYLNGVGIWRSEADLNELVCAYDMKTIQKDDPLIINVRDQKYHISPMARLNMYFYDNVYARRDRGVSVTPIGLVLDRFNGYAPLYMGRRVYGIFPPTPTEEVMWAIFNHVFKPVPENPAYNTSSFGDVFDVITNDAGKDFLKTYQALYLTGDVTLDKKFSAGLQEYVREGGTLIVNAELLGKYPDSLPRNMTGVSLTQEFRQSPGTYSLLSGKVIHESKPYTYRVLKAFGNARSLAVTSDAARNPAILLHKFGKGYVIVTAPCDMKHRGNMENMLALFDDLMAEVRKQSLPVVVESSMQYSINRDRNSYIVYFQNNAGIPPSRGVFQEVLKCDASIRSEGTVKIPHSLGRVKKVIDWWTGKELPFRDNGSEAVLKTELVSGDCCALEFVME